MHLEVCSEAGEAMRRVGSSSRDLPPLRCNRIVSAATVLVILSCSFTGFLACSSRDSADSTSVGKVSKPSAPHDSSLALARLWVDLVADSEERQTDALHRLLSEPQLAETRFDGHIASGDGGDWFIDSHDFAIGVFDDGLETFALRTIPSMSSSSGELGELQRSSKIRLLMLIDDLAIAKRRWALELAEADVDPGVAVFETFGLVSLQDSLCGEANVIRSAALKCLETLANSDDERMTAASRKQVFRSDRKNDIALHRASREKWDAVGADVKERLESLRNAR